MFKIIGRYVPPPAGVRPPALWGSRDRIAELFGKHAAPISAVSRHFVFRYRSPAHWLQIFRDYYGPTLKAFAALEPAGRKAFAEDLLALVERFNRSKDGSMIVPSEYLEVVINRR
jgi:hypothetical protein